MVEFQGVGTLAQNSRRKKRGGRTPLGSWAKVHGECHRDAAARAAGDGVDQHEALLGAIHSRGARANRAGAEVQRSAPWRPGKSPGVQ